MQHTSIFSTALLAIAASVTLAACGRADEPTAGAQLDAAIAKTEQKAEEVKADVGQAVDAAKADAQAAADRAAASMDKTTDRAAAAIDKTTDRAAAAIDKATDQAGQALTDAGITTSVNAELAKDPALSALKINVDTSAGKVVLRGTAPSTDARERATRLAQGVRGVVAVDNMLDVRG